MKNGLFGAPPEARALLPAYADGVNSSVTVTRISAAVYDLSVPECPVATIIFSTGQSGNPFSTHYRDLAQRWGPGGPSAYVNLARPSVAATLLLRGKQ